MNDYTVENWFPRPIYYADNVCTDNLGMFEKRIKNIVQDKGTKTTKFLGVQSTHLTECELHLDPIFRPLCETIGHHVFNFATILGYDSKKSFNMTIGNMWANVSDQHGYNFPHTHPGSVISGAFYVKTASENVIAFYDKYEVIELPGENTPYNGSPVSYNCVPGRMLLFKSDFIHGNPAQESVGEKIVISFNMVF